MWESPDALVEMHVLVPLARPRWGLEGLSL